MFCPQCGYKLAPTDGTCPRCADRWAHPTAPSPAPSGAMRTGFFGFLGVWFGSLMVWLASLSVACVVPTCGCLGIIAVILTLAAIGRASH